MAEAANDTMQKIGLPGERLWGRIIEQHADDSAVLEIVSQPIGDLHQFQKGDTVLCSLDERGLWCPTAEIFPFERST